MIAFASIDSQEGRLRTREARRLIRGEGIKDSTWSPILKDNATRLLDLA